MSYAFRPLITLKQLCYDREGPLVRYHSKKGQDLRFKPNDFIALLTQHIPDRYQNMRRYGGFYAANVRTRIRQALALEDQQTTQDIKMASPMKLKWAALIAKIFGENPIRCPRCQKDMQLKGFLLKTILMFKDIQVLSRAPPLKEFPKYRDLPGQTISYEIEESQAATPWPISRIKDGPDDFFDQSMNG